MNNSVSSHINYSLIMNLINRIPNYVRGESNTDNLLNLQVSQVQIPFSILIVLNKNYESAYKNFLRKQCGSTLCFSCKEKFIRKDH